MLNPFASTVAVRPVATVRIVVGVLSIMRGLLEWQTMRRIVRPGLVQFPIIDGLPPIGPRFAFSLIAIWLISAVVFTVGWRVRIAGLVLFSAMLVTLLSDQQLYSSVLYLITLEVLLIAFANPSNGMRGVEYWPILLLKIQLSLVYLFAALAKINPAYLSGLTLGSNLRFSLRFGPDFYVPLAIASIIGEIFLAIGFWFERSRSWAILFGIGLHVAMVAMLVPPAVGNLAIFAVACVALYPLYNVKPSTNCLETRP